MKSYSESSVTTSIKPSLNQKSSFFDDARVRLFSVVVLLYVFLVGVKTLSGGLKLMGSGFAEQLFDLTSNPAISLVAGMLATVLFQSSSVSTSIIVGLVSAGTITVGGAVPMIMGANIGTSVTNTLVSMGYVKNQATFKRAFAAATVHDFFNFLSVLILLPLELMTGVIEKMATFSTGFVYGASSGAQFSSPVKMAIQPAAKGLKSLSVSLFGSGAAAGIAMMVLAAILILVSLATIVQVMSHFVNSKEGQLVDRMLTKNTYMTVVFGIFVTVAAQSSSITTSLLVPLAGTGLVGLQTIFAVTVGANIGTTATALLAAMTGSPSGLTIALVHLYFNILGTVIFFVPPMMRRLPILCAETLAKSMDKSKAFGLAYVVIVFFLLPISLIYFYK